MNESNAIIPSERIERGILIIRGQKVLLDADIADLYGVPTKRLNEQVKRNADRFPPDFMFTLTAEEKEQVVAKCDHLRRLRFSSTLPNAFTEHGAVMLASILNSKVAVSASIQVVRSFMRLRQMLASQSELAKKLVAMEKKYDTRFKVVFDAIRRLTSPDEKPKKKIGFD